MSDDTPAAPDVAADDLVRKAVDERTFDWGVGTSLQTDSYATCRQIVYAFLHDNNILIQLTDGNQSWQTTLPLPRKWNP